jgi:hypothetical protein
MINLTKIQNAIAESISNSTRPTITIKAPDIYAVTAAMDSQDASAIAFGPSWHVDGTTDAGDAFTLSIRIQQDYSEYEVRVSNDPSYYGTECTPDDGDRIANAICELIENQFPGIQTELWMECHCSSSTTGPNEDTVQSIDEWIELNWTAAL